VATFVPLAVGQSDSGYRPADSWIVTRSLGETEPLDNFLMKTLPAFAPEEQVRLRQRVAATLGAFVARMHDAGVIHHDLHPGNVLVRRNGEAIELFLIDLHAVQLTRPLDWPASRDNLVILNHWFTMRASRTDRLRFWRAYCEARQEKLPFAPAEVRAALPVELEKRTWLSNLAFWRARDRRCLANNRYYQRLRSAAAVGHATSDLPADLRETLLADPDAPFAWPGIRLLKDSRSSTVAEFEIAIDGQPRQFIYKRFRVTAWSDPWVALLRRSPALRSWVHGHGLRERCLPTPRPLLVLHRRRAGLLREGYLLAEKVADAVDLHAFVAGLASLSPAIRRGLLRRRIEQLAGLVRELHRRRMAHRDLKAANVLLSPPEQLWLIDLVGVSRYEQLPRERRVKDLARLHASFHQSAAVTRTDKLRFLRVYLQWGLFGRSGWKRWWQQVEVATAAKVAQNRRRGRVLM
jgi:tRNA A-37 threonylcarbamoyl transferase component Bud32